MTLKDICPYTGNSPLWDMPIEKIVPSQISAHRARLILDGTHQDRADALIYQIVESVITHCDKSPLSAFSLVSFHHLTSGELAKAFLTMSHPRPAALLFALEMKMDIESVITLKQAQLKDLKFTPLAAQIIRAQPTHIRSPYVFWSDRKGRPNPLFGLAEEALDAFGRSWSDMIVLYSRIVFDSQECG